MSSLRNGVAFVALAALASGGVAQTLAHFPDASTPTTSGNTQPFNWTASPQFTQFIQYPGTPASPSGGGTTSLQAQGVAPGALLTELACVPTTAGGGTYATFNAHIVVGHVVGSSVATQWIANLVDPVVLYDSTYDGPLTIPWSPGTWTPYVSLGECAAGLFYWNGVDDVGIQISVQQAGATSNNFSSSTPSPAIFIRHGCSTAYIAPPGTASTTTGTLGMRQRMTFGGFVPFRMGATTSGGGAGDLTLDPLTSVPPGTSEGFMLVTADTTGAICTGPAFGIYPDAITWDVVMQPALPGSPLHWVAGFPGLYPQAPIVVAPGTLSFLAGQSWRVVSIAFGPGFVYLGRTQVVQLNW
jgi:hypothetical protein